VYEDFFGLQQRPFSLVPSAEDFVELSPLQDALDSLVHCVSQSRGMAILTSAPGLGKTMLCRRLAKLLEQNHRSIFLSAAGMETRLSLLQGLLFELNMGYVGLTDQEARLKVLQAARSAKLNRRCLLLILDEAHELTTRLFEELRTLTEYAPDGETIIHAVLCGSFELEEKLVDPALTAFNQRIGLQVCLTPLSLNDSARFISERFKAAGEPDILSVMTEQALELLCRASDGNLHCLGQLTDHACLLAFADGCKPITESIVRTALENMKELPLRWGDVPGEASSREQMEAHRESNVENAPLEQPSESQPSATPAGRFSSTDQETDEFPIPRFLQSDSPDEQGEGADEPSLPHNTEQHSPDASEAPPEFAVFEVGAGIDSAGIGSEEAAALEQSANQSTEKPMSAETFQIFSFPSTSNKASSEETGEQPGMTEVPVLDRYALLDRMFELPEDRRDTIDLSCLDQQPAEINPQAFPAGSETSSEEVTEEDLLELVQQIRRDVQVQLTPNPHARHTVPAPHQTIPIHLVGAAPTPAMESAFQAEPVTEMGGVMEGESESGNESGTMADPIPHRRFEQLFTRLRLRRKKVEAEQHRR